MGPFVVLVIVVVVVAALDVAALRWGVDSSQSSTDPRRPVEPTGII